MRINVHHIFPLAMFLGASTATIAQDAAAPEGTAARVSAQNDLAIVSYDRGNGHLWWDPVVGYERLTLVVHGPQGWSLKKEFPAGSLPALQLLSDDGSPFVDGGYDWELTLTPLIDPGLMASLAAERANNTAEIHPELAALLPRGGAVQSGHFHVHHGQLVLPWLEELNSHGAHPRGSSSAGNGGDPAQGGATDQVILDDLIVDGSLCVGQDCVTAESFGFDTIRVKETNLRINFTDTSSTASFPNNDWQITANDSSNGGANKFSLDDLSGGKTPFTIEANAPTNALFVDDGGRVGFGTNVPVVELHSKDGDTPTLRLEQDGSSGFTSQTWDVAGNETNFFIRDTTNGSALPFRIFPSAPSDALTIEAGGQIGMGTTSPDAALDIESSSSFVTMRLTAAGASPNKSADMTYTDGGDAGAFRININDSDNHEFELDDDGNLTLRSSESFITLRLMAGAASRNMAADLVFTDAGAAGEFRVNIDSSDNHEMGLDHDGNMTIDGSLTTGTQTIPDYVFKPGYSLMPLGELAEFIQREQHLPKVPSEDDVKASGSLNMSALQLTLLEKVEELTLYTLAQETQLTDLQAENAALQQRLLALEKAFAVALQK
ncbi:MAG: hypothetical protein ACI9EF_000511 [Pseudohongiellaceae bacterium]